jgi:protein-disulfide isomerase
MKVLLSLLAACALSTAGSPANRKASGSPSAPITIEVFSDFQCPACKVLHEQTLAPLMKDYVVTGKVYLVHHEFPLPQHTYARLAASYACAAARLGKYEEIGNLLFRTQAGWTVTGKVDETVASVLTPAEAKTVRTLAKEPAIAAEIQSDIDLGHRVNVGQTPTLIFKSRRGEYPMPGAVNYDLLRSLIDRTLGE